MGIRICPKCGGKVSTARNDCVHCGYVFPSTKKCPDCEELVDINAKECPICGYPFEPLENKEPSKEETPVIPVDSPSIEPQPVIEETPVEEKPQEEDAEPSLECPYCHEHQLMEIGVGAYMCITCKMRFLSTSDAKVRESVAPSIEVPDTPIQIEPVPEVEEEPQQVEETQQTEEQPQGETQTEPEIVEEVPIDEIVEEEREDVLACPYCGESHLMQLGIDFYMCETCKMKFPSLSNAKASVSPVSSIEIPPVVKPTPVIDQESGSQPVEETPAEQPAKKQTVKEKPQKQSKALGIIVISVLAGLAVSCFVGFALINPAYQRKQSQIYNDGIAYLDTDVDAAIKCFEKSNYGDANRQIGFAKARKAFNEGDISGIKTMYENGGSAYVNFFTDGGEYIPSSEGAILYKDGFPRANKDGYCFYGWSVASYQFSENNYRVELTLQALWDPNQYLLSVITNDSNGGTASMTYHDETLTSANVKYTEEVVLTASPNAGYTFDGWYEGDNVLSTSNPYTYTMPSRNHTITAHWSLNYYTFTVTNNISGAGEFSIGNYDAPWSESISEEHAYNSNIVVFAHPCEGYTFVGWYEGADFISSDSSYTFTMPLNSYNITACWTINQYRFRLLSSNSFRGTVEGDVGWFNYHSIIVVRATPSENCVFDGWYINENLISTDPTYSFVLPADNTTLIGRFSSPITYTVTLTNDDENAGCIAGGGTYQLWDKVHLMAYPYTTYAFNRWYDNDIDTSPFDDPSIEFYITRDYSFTGDWVFDGDDMFNFESNDGGSSYVINSVNSEYLNDYLIMLPRQHNGKPVTGNKSGAFEHCRDHLFWVPSTFYFNGYEHISETAKSSYERSYSKPHISNEGIIYSTYVDNDLEKASIIEIHESISYLSVPDYVDDYYISKTFAFYMNKEHKMNVIYFPTYDDRRFGASTYGKTICLYNFEWSYWSTPPSQTTNPFYYGYRANVFGATGEYGIENGIYYAIGKFQGEEMPFIVGCDENITSLEIPETFLGYKHIAISDEAFRELNIMNVDIKCGVKFIGYCSFCNCPIFSVSINFECDSLYIDSFSNCNNLKSFQIPNCVSTIYSYAIYGCQSLTAIWIPKTVETIKAQAFYGCGNAVIYCESESAKTSWDSKWNNYNYSDGVKLQVIYGATLEQYHAVVNSL